MRRARSARARRAARRRAGRRACPGRRATCRSYDHSSTPVRQRRREDQRAPTLEPADLDERAASRVTREPVEQRGLVDLQRRDAVVELVRREEEREILEARERSGPLLDVCESASRRIAQAQTRGSGSSRRRVRPRRRTSCFDAPARRRTLLQRTDVRPGVAQPRGTPSGKSHCVDARPTPRLESDRARVATARRRSPRASHRPPSPSRAPDNCAGPHGAQRMQDATSTSAVTAFQDRRPHQQAEPPTAFPLDENVSAECNRRQRWQPARSPPHEDERVGNGRRDSRDHPGREIDDQPPEFSSRAAPVARCRVRDG